MMDLTVAVRKTEGSSGVEERLALDPSVVLEL